MPRVFYLLSLLLLSLCSLAQTYDYSIGQQTEKVDSFRYWLEELVSLGVRQTGNPELNDARDWIVQKYRSFGYEQIELDTFTYAGDELYNIIIEKPGFQRPA